MGLLEGRQARRFPGRVAVRRRAASASAAGSYRAYANQAGCGSGRPQQRRKRGRFAAVAAQAGVIFARFTSSERPSARFAIPR